MQKEYKFVCQNDSSHGLLRRSKFTPTSFVCDKCEGFACWDLKELNQVNIKAESSYKTQNRELTQANVELKKLISHYFNNQVLPFNFRLLDKNNFQDSLDQSLVLEAIDVVSGQVTKKAKIHEYTKQVMEKIVSELSFTLQKYISWD